MSRWIMLLNLWVPSLLIFLTRSFCGSTPLHCQDPNCAYQCQNNPIPDSGAQCGPSTGNAQCPGDSCCSEWGFCGTTEEHCHAPHCLYQCDVNPQPPTQDGVCGPDFPGDVCPEGSCCSKFGYCGYSDLHCLAPDCISQCRA